jgi:hypothetical protein
MHGEGSSQRRDKECFLLKAKKNYKSFKMNRKQNVGEAFSGVGRLRKKGRVFFHGLLRQKQKTARNVPGGSWVPRTASGAQTEFIR